MSCFYGGCLLLSCFFFFKKNDENICFWVWKVRKIPSFGSWRCTVLKGQEPWCNPGYLIINGGPGYCGCGCQIHLSPPLAEEAADLHFSLQDLAIVTHEVFAMCRLAHMIASKTIVKILAHRVGLRISRRNANQAWLPLDEMEHWGLINVPKLCRQIHFFSRQQNCSSDSQRETSVVSTQSCTPVSAISNQKLPVLILFPFEIMNCFPFPGGSQQIVFPDGIAYVIVCRIFYVGKTTHSVRTCIVE